MISNWWQNIFLLAPIILFSSTTSTGCTSHDKQSCIIDRATKWNNTVGNITCDANYSSCTITCDGIEEHVCSKSMDIYNNKNNNMNNPYLICPATDKCETCIINCHSKFSCQNAIILSNKCKYVEINIGSQTNAGNQMYIYTPTNNGSLTVNLTHNISQFSSSHIYTNPATYGVDIYCGNNGNKCINNTINAELMNGDMNLYCYSPTDSDINCDFTTIYCPINRGKQCNIQCSRCQHTNIYTMDGITNLNWKCAQQSDSCYNSILRCGSSKYPLVWKNNSKQWVYENHPNLCGNEQLMTTEIMDNNDDRTDERIMITVNNLIYGAVFVILLMICCCIMIGLFYIYQYAQFMKQQKEYVEMVKQNKFVELVQVEPVCESQRIRPTLTEKLKPPSMAPSVAPSISRSVSLPSPQRVQSVSIESASEHIGSDHEVHSAVSIHSADPKTDREPGSMPSQIEESDIYSAHDDKETNNDSSDDDMYNNTLRTTPQ